ncbi:synaptonemal complex protein 1 isoform X2 [Hoplias malabaricus]|uniref:synaptonemal complex protein 1 isoform X2 n=1 Tax=Hoplias malabaricus TaxID=27720 RepID=UPI003462E2C5
MERAFKFKLLVPPKNTLPQVSTVKPQDSARFEERNSFMSPLQVYDKCFDKETSLPFPNTNMVLPTKSLRAEVTKTIAVLPVEKEETSLRCSQLYSKLFEEAEKIKSWKLKMDSEILQKDRMLQENRRTIETQRKAIQELQFGNESLSMNLEQQLNENEDLRNKSNATRNLCNILKDTFERSSEKMSLFEAEKEETHNLLMQNHENIQRMVAAFENLRMQADADQLEMLKVRDGLKQFEDLKLRFENEYHIKEEEVSLLEGKLKEKKEEHKELLLSLQESHQRYSELKESATQHQELLHNSKQEQDKLEEKLKRAEQLRQEAEEYQKSVTNMLEQIKEKHAKNIQERDAKLEEVHTVKKQLARELEEMKITVESLQCTLKSDKQWVQELESKLSKNSKALDEKNAELGKIKEENVEWNNQMHILKNELEMKSNALKSFEEKMKADGEKILQITAESEEKEREINELKTELKDTESKFLEALKNKREASTCVKTLEKDLNQHKEKYDELLERFHELQLQKNTMQQQVEGCFSETSFLESCLKETKANEQKMKMNVKNLKAEKQQLEKQVEILNARTEQQRQDCENIQEQINESNKIKSELMKKERCVKAQEQKLTNLKSKLESKTKALEENIKENKALKKQIALGSEKHVQYKEELAKLKEESQKLKEHHEKELSKISSELENKTTLEAQLALEVEKLKLTAMEAVKSKEDTEFKCQQKISDMVALMERHKHEYDKLVEEKDAQLNEKRMCEAEVNAKKTSLELELSHVQVENGQLKKQLEEVKMEKGNMQQEVEELTKMQTFQKESYMEKEGHLKKQIMALKKQVKYSDKDNIQKIHEITPKNDKSLGTPDVTTETSTCALSKKAELETSPKLVAATPVVLGENILKTSTWALEARRGATPQIKTFRIRTPPSADKSAPWRKNILELDPKSDSSEQNDSFSSIPVKSRKCVQAKEYETESLGIVKKVENSGVYKSPGMALKLAAIKRMRDAGWTTITSADKKKKKVTDKIFA